MKQQINLYKSLPRISKNWVGEMFVLQIAAGFLALLFLVTIIQVIALQWEKHNISSLQKKYLVANASFAQEHSQGGVDLVKLQAELASQKQLLDMLHVQAQTEQSCSFLSDYFQSFSLAQTPGLWVSKFTIEPDTRNMTFDGLTYDPVLIVNWIKALGKTPCFAGTKFQTIEIQRSSDETNKNLMSFSVGSIKALPMGGKK